MNAIRSIVFNIFYIGGSLACSIVLLPLLLLPTRLCAKYVGEAYGGYMRLIEKYILGLKLEIRGLEHLPQGPYILAPKHQSAYETLKLPFMGRLGYPAIILKKELVYLPIYGWYFWGMGQIPIDRGEGTKALQSIINGCKKAIDAGRSVIIFPQGTRTAPGAQKPYKVGIAKVYRDVHAPVVPMALNSGVFWGRNAFFKKPGTVIFEFLPPIPAGLPPLQMMEQLEKVTEEATDRLVREATQ